MYSKYYNTRPILFILGLIFIFLLQSNTITSQIKQSSSAEIYQALKKLNVLGSVLYIAAHPDDENNVVLTYLSKEKLVRTGYLSLTRGDGGQNLLGNEKGDLLGVIRTQELLSARKIDGAEQFFTRAIDFGFSKSSEETLKNWNKELLLGDIVKVIRQFKPDIVITRFTKTLGGHGHHLVSAILAEEAFYAAADPKRFPEQLKDLETWQAKRIIWDAFVPSSKAIPVDVGIYNRILGKSYNELSSDSRSMHKSQGFGAAPARGSQIVQFDHIAGDTAKNDIFENINLTWKRISGGDKIEQLINQVTNDFDYDNPEKSIPNLIEIYNLLDKIENKYWSKIKKKETAELIR
ncbi:MAG: PIG-L family deacetylase, partial [Melioribacteraceae bacterium]